MKNNYLISTGGSGGHVIPATILYEHLSEEANVFISTDERGSKYLNQDIYKSKIINTPKLNNILFLPFALIKIFFLIIKSFFLLRDKKITKLISTGGYMSLPLIVAGKILCLKIYLLEPNLVLGRANRYFLNSCCKIFCYSDKIKNFPDNLKHKLVIINPLVRKEIYKMIISSEKKNKFNLLIVGGSQGASIFDNNLKNTIVSISQKFTIKIFQQTSEKNITFLQDFYSKNGIENSIFSFDNNFFNIIHQADLCITRAGATTLAELSVLNKPFIAVPLPTSKDNHQLENANFYKNNDACWVIKQDFFEDNIKKVLNDILNNKTDYFKKKDNLKKLNYQNTWINVNQKILRNINEN